MDLRILSGAMPTPSPIAMLESSSERKACSLTTRIRINSNASDASVMKTRYGPLTGIQRPIVSVPLSPEFAQDVEARIERECESPALYARAERGHTRGHPGTRDLARDEGAGNASHGKRVPLAHVAR